MGIMKKNWEELEKTFPKMMSKTHKEDLRRSFYSSLNFMLKFISEVNDGIIQGEEDDKNPFSLIDLECTSFFEDPNKDTKEGGFLKEGWEQFRKNCILPKMPEEGISNMKKIFYNGVSCVLNSFFKIKKEEDFEIFLKDFQKDNFEFFRGLEEQIDLEKSLKGSKT